MFCISATWGTVSTHRMKANALIKYSIQHRSSPIREHTAVQPNDHCFRQAPAGRGASACARAWVGGVVGGCPRRRPVAAPHRRPVAAPHRPSEGPRPAAPRPQHPAPAAPLGPCTPPQHTLVHLARMSVAHPAFDGAVPRFVGIRVIPHGVAHRHHVLRQVNHEVVLDGDVPARPLPVAEEAYFGEEEGTCVTRSHVAVATSEADHPSRMHQSPRTFPCVCISRVPSMSISNVRRCI